MLARLEMLSSIDPSWIAVVIVCAAAWSRGCAVLVATSLAPAQPPGVGVVLGALLLACAPGVAAALWTQDFVVWGTAAALALLAAAVLRRQTRKRLTAAPAPSRHGGLADRGGSTPDMDMQAVDDIDTDADTDTDIATRRRTNAVLGVVQVIGELAFLVGVLATLIIVEDTGEPDYS